jgi:hypothetical protein
MAEGGKQQGADLESWKSRAGKRGGIDVLVCAIPRYLLFDLSVYSMLS